MPECLRNSGILAKIMSVPLFSFHELQVTPRQMMQSLEAEIRDHGKMSTHVATTEWAGRHEDAEQSPEGTPPLVPIVGRFADRRAAVATISMKDNSKEAMLVAEVDAAQLLTVSNVFGMEMLYQNKPESSASLHNLAKGLPVIPAGAQPVILGKAFAIKLGLVGDALQDSAWRIRTTGGQVEKVHGETREFLNISFNPGTAQAVHLRLRCLFKWTTNQKLCSCLRQARLLCKKRCTSWS